MQEISMGEIIRNRRIELGLTQEKVCEGIYEPPTMSRIENDKQTPSYSKLVFLLQRLGLPDDRYYALLSDHDIQIRDLEKEIVSCNVLGKYKEGLEFIEQLESIADTHDIHVQQLILRSKTILGKIEKNEIKPHSPQEKLKILLRAIGITSPKFDLDEIGRGLYGLDEVKIINHIAGVFF